MSNNGGINRTLNAGESYTIPAGYHNGTGRIDSKDLSSQTPGTATSDDILEGKTAWVNGSQITGTMTKNSKGTDISSYFNMNRQTKSGKGTVEIATASSKSIDLNGYDYLEFTYAVEQHNRPVCRVSVGSNTFNLAPYNGTHTLIVPISKYNDSRTITFRYGDSNATTNYTIAFQLVSVVLK